MPLFDEDHLRALIRSEVDAALVDFAERRTPTPTPTPEPFPTPTPQPPQPEPEPPAHQGKPLDPSDVILMIDPLDPGTFGPNRPFGQAWAAANMFQLGQRKSYIAEQVGDRYAWRYSLNMSETGHVPSFKMEDGTTTRYGAWDLNGKRMMRFATQFRHGDGYHTDNDKYVNGWQINTAIDIRPGRSDQVTFRGSRSGLSGIGANLSVGPAAPMMIWGMNLRVEPWMFSTSSVGGPFDLHAPGAKLTGPMVLAVDSGELIAWSKHSPSGQLLDVNKATNDNAGLKNLHLVNYKLDRAMIGKELPIIVACRVDRTGRNNHFEMFTLDETGQLKLIGYYEQPYGYGMKGKANGLFYPIAQCYLWKGSWMNPDLGGNPPWNHDDSHGNIYEMNFSAFAVSTSVTVQRMADHLLWHLLRIR